MWSTYSKTCVASLSFAVVRYTARSRATASIMQLKCSGSSSLLRRELAVRTASNAAAGGIRRPALLAARGAPVQHQQASTSEAAPNAVVVARALPVATEAYRVAEAAQASTSAPALAPLSPALQIAAAAGGLILLGAGIKRVYDTPSRTYNQNVGQEYDTWTQVRALPATQQVCDR